MEQSLSVWVHDTLVGELYQDRFGRFGFKFSDAYRSSPSRPTLSEFYVQSNLTDDAPGKGGLPPFFANIVPEGQLRRLLGLTGKSPTADFAFLHTLGTDLPGALQLRNDGGRNHPGPVPGTEPIQGPAGKLRFSLAGQQIKFSVDEAKGKVVVPVRGSVGHFIAKLDDPSYAEVPLVEHAVMEWATAAGINAASTRLAPAESIDDLPLIGKYTGGPALLVARYDRSGGVRVHSEEFAQVFGITVDDRYRLRGWAHHLKLIATVCPADIHEYVRRLLFVIASGNGDAHNKNWSFVYPDRRSPRLSPAYDQLCVSAWSDDPRLKDALPFEIAGNKAWDRVRLPQVARLLEKAGIAEFESPEGVDRTTDAEGWLHHEVARIAESAGTAFALGPDRLRAALSRHWSRVPMLRDHRLRTNE